MATHKGFPMTWHVVRIALQGGNYIRATELLNGTLPKPNAAQVVSLNMMGARRGALLTFNSESNYWSAQKAPAHWEQEVY